MTTKPTLGIVHRDPFKKFTREKIKEEIKIVVNATGGVSIQKALKRYEIRWSDLEPILQELKEEGAIDEYTAPGVMFP